MSDPWLDVRIGDCRDVLDTLPDQSVHCVVTSPPYWGLRDYGHGDQIGLEPTPEAYVEAMVDVFRKVRRVLRDDGTLWLNLGDSYAAGGGSDTQRLDALGERLGTGGGKKHSSRPSGRAPLGGLKPKDLVGIPWRVAFALQADGWYLRSDIIWSKPNPMPESVTDRPTKAHEYLFMLSKSQRYYFDQEAVREPHTESTLARVEYGLKHQHPDGIGVGIPPVDTDRMGERFANPAGRNIRSVWTIPTKPYPGAHFAVFPSALVEPCIKAGTSERGVCATCGAPWEREVERPAAPAEVFTERHAPTDGKVHSGSAIAGEMRGHGQKMQDWRDLHPSRTTGWSPTCDHTHGETLPAAVLDPFGGSGTVGQVANKISRRAVLIELNPDYGEQIEKRTAQTPLGLGA